LPVCTTTGVDHESDTSLLRTTASRAGTCRRARAKAAAVSAQRRTYRRRAGGRPRLHHWPIMASRGASSGRCQRDALATGGRRPTPRARRRRLEAGGRARLLDLWLFSHPRSTTAEDHGERKRPPIASRRFSPLGQCGWAAQRVGHWSRPARPWGAQLKGRGVMQLKQWMRTVGIGNGDLAGRREYVANTDSTKKQHQCQNNKNR